VSNNKHLFNFFLFEWSELERCFIATASQLCLEHAIGNDPGQIDGTEINWDTSAAQLLVYAEDVNLLGDNINNTEALIGCSKEVGLEVNTKKN
jgi:hypothetical protein